MSLYDFAKGVLGIYCLAFRTKVEGLENIPADGGFIICPNHKSNNDPILLGVKLPIKLSFMAKAELFGFKPFAAILRKLGAFPVKRGKSDIGALRAALEIVKNGGRLLLFPEGTRSDLNNLKKGKAGAALIALKANVKLLPVGICGKYGFFSKMKINIGKPIDLSEYYNKKTDTETVQMITDKLLMPAISELSGVVTYENRNCG